MVRAPWMYACMVLIVYDLVLNQLLCSILCHLHWAHVPFPQSRSTDETLIVMICKLVTLLWMINQLHRPMSLLNHELHESMNQCLVMKTSHWNDEKRRIKNKKKREREKKFIIKIEIMLNSLKAEIKIISMCVSVENEPFAHILWWNPCGAIIFGTSFYFLFIFSCSWKRIERGSWALSTFTKINAFREEQHAHPIDAKHTKSLQWTRSTLFLYTFLYWHKLCVSFFGEFYSHRHK